MAMIPSETAHSTETSTNRGTGRAEASAARGVVQQSRVAADLPEVTQLVQSLFEERSLLDRVRGQDRRLAILTRIAESREVRVVANLCP